MSEIRNDIEDILVSVKMNECDVEWGIDAVLTLLAAAWDEGGVEGSRGEYDNPYWP